MQGWGPVNKDLPEQLKKAGDDYIRLMEFCKTEALVFNKFGMLEIKTFGNGDLQSISVSLGYRNF